MKYWILDRRNMVFFKVSWNSPDKGIWTFKIMLNSVKSVLRAPEQQIDIVDRNKRCQNHHFEFYLTVLLKQLFIRFIFIFYKVMEKCVPCSGTLVCTFVLADLQDRNLDWQISWYSCEVFLTTSRQRPDFDGFLISKRRFPAIFNTMACPATSLNKTKLHS